MSKRTLSLPPSRVACLATALVAGVVATSGCGADGTPEEGPRVEVEVQGEGTVFSRPSGVACGTTPEGAPRCDAPFREDDVVALAARPEPGWVFRGWSGDCEGTARLTELDVAGANKRCAAEFSEWAPGDFVLNPRELSLTVDGPGTVTIEPGDIECRTDATCRLEVEEFSTFTLSVSYREEAFLGWDGDCQGDATSLQVTLSRDKACRAVFDDAIYYPVRIEVQGEGYVESAPSGIYCGEGHSSCEHAFKEGEVIVLSAVAGSGSFFDGWGHQCTDAFGNPITSSVIEFTAEYGLACSAAFAEGFNPDPFPTDVPSAWVCSEAFYDDGSLCDCGCGAPDPDCLTDDPFSCDYCDGGCGTGSCPANIATPNWTCTGGGGGGVPAAWTCSDSYYGTGDGCDCGCGAVDPDCSSALSSACEYCTDCFGCDQVNPTNNGQCL